MKTSRGIAGLLLLAALPCGAEIVAPGIYRGYVREDRWGQKALQAGPYAQFVADWVFDQLRGVIGQPVELDVVEIYQPTNPGAGRIETIRSVEPWEMGVLLELRADSTWSRTGEGVLLTLIVHNRAEPDLWWPPDSLRLVITTRRPVDTLNTLDASGRNPWPYRNGWSNVLEVLAMGGEAEEAEQLFLAAREVPVEWSEVHLGHLDPCGFNRLPPGHTLIEEVVVGSRLPPGEYEVFAFWDGSGNAGGSDGAQSNVVSFDVQEP